MKNQKSKFSLSNTNKCIVVIGVNKYENNNYPYVFDTLENEELAKKAIIERGSPLEIYRIFDCKFVKNIKIEHKLKED